MTFRHAPPPAIPRSKLKEWRLHRGMTIEQVVQAVALAAPRVAISPAKLSKIENGRQPWKQDLVEALANVYDTSPSDLLFATPGDEDALHLLISTLDDREREVLKRVAEGLKGTWAKDEPE